MEENLSEGIEVAKSAVYYIQWKELGIKFYLSTHLKENKSQLMFIWKRKPSFS